MKPSPPHMYTHIYTHTHLRHTRVLTGDLVSGRLGRVDAFGATIAHSEPVQHGTQAHKHGQSSHSTCLSVLTVSFAYSKRQRSARHLHKDRWSSFIRSKTASFPLEI
ncbi:hypothetical protein BaRGS_00030534 [Batillaria attramentaria]|uniref:Uncharacterized protein n=1 Tax=Batillaria attramentaria TaxID=370345 RepID=A0ABD0JTX5_9CAEN